MRWVTERFGASRGDASRICCIEWLKRIRSDGMLNGCRESSGTVRKHRNGLFSARGNWRWSNVPRSRCCWVAIRWIRELGLGRDWERSRASVTRCNWMGGCVISTKRSKRRENLSATDKFKEIFATKKHKKLKMVS